jgi:hypothetical protein
MKRRVITLNVALVVAGCAGGVATPGAATVASAPVTPAAVELATEPVASTAVGNLTLRDARTIYETVQGDVTVAKGGVLIL